MTGQPDVFTVRSPAWAWLLDDFLASLDSKVMHCPRKINCGQNIKDAVRGFQKGTIEENVFTAHATRDIFTDLISFGDSLYCMHSMRAGNENKEYKTKGVGQF